MLFVMDSGQTGPYHGAMATAHSARSELDHIVVAARTLEEGSAWVEAALGVAPVPGGKHASRQHELVERTAYRRHDRYLASGTLWRFADPGFQRQLAG